MNKNFFGIGIIFCAVIILTAQPKNIYAYDNDTHFWLSYYLAIKTGYSPIQATQIAAANVSVDFDKHVTPVVSKPATFLDWRHPQGHLQDVRSRYHALPWTSAIFRHAKTVKCEEFWWNPTIESKEKIQEIMLNLVNEQKEKFWKETLDDNKNQNPGMFLHYLQDTYAHKNFRSYIGHAGYYGVDFLSTDRKKAEDMTFETLKYLLVFRYQYLKKTSPESLTVVPALEFDPKDFNAIKNLQIEKILSAETILEIKKTLEKLCDANISGGMQKNQLVGVWDELMKGVQPDCKKTPKVLLKDRRPPRAFFKPLGQIVRYGIVPDSRKARQVIKDVLGVNEDRLPHIWLYDYNKFGSKKTAVKARKYRATIDYVSKPYQTASDENKSTEKSKIFLDKKRQCLPFNLVDEKDSRIPFCSELKTK